MSAFHCRISRVNDAPVLQGGQNLAVMDIDDLGCDAQPAAYLDDFFLAALRQRAAGSLPVPDIAVGGGNELDVMPILAHFMATPAPRYSASSGWAPKTMIRSLPSLAGCAGAGAGVRAGAAALAIATHGYGRAYGRPDNDAQPAGAHHSPRREMRFAFSCRLVPLLQYFSCFRARGAAISIRGRNSPYLSLSPIH